MNTTKEGIEVKRGQIWKDLDKRNTYERIMRISDVADGYAYGFLMVNGQAGKSLKIAIRRMHKTSTGWALVSGAA